MALKFLNDGYFAGKVGIGTESPDRKLHVKDSNIVVSEFEGTNTGSLLDLVNSNASQLYNGIRFTQGTSSKMAVTHIADGTTKGYVQIGNSWATGSEILVVDGRTSNVGIGTTSPTYKLQVAGKSYLSGGVQLNSGDRIDFGNSQQYITGVNSTSLTLVTGNSATLTALDNGNVGIGTISPTQKLVVTGNIGTSGSVLFDDNQGINFGNSNAKIIGTSADGIKFFGTGSEKMRLTQAGNFGIGTTNPASKLHVVSTTNDNATDNTVKISHSRSDTDVGTNALYIDMNLSGADATTADRQNRGIFVDIDSTADGDATNEHRIRGVNSDVRFSGFSDIVQSGYFYAESNNNTVKTAQLIGVYGNSVHDSSTTSGGVSNMYGVYGLADIQDLGDVDNAFGGFFQVNIGGSRGNANIGITKGVEGQINIDKATTIDYGTMMAVSAIIDNNEGAVPNFGNQFLFRGDYQGDRGSDAYGIYCEGDKHYLEGKLAINLATPTQALHVAGNARVTGAYYDSNNSPGTANQVLVSTVTGTDWIDGSAIPGVPAGSGTLNTVAMWTPDGDTLGDGPITFSGNNSTFSGAITIGTHLILQQDGTNDLIKSTGNVLYHKANEYSFQDNSSNSWVTIKSGKVGIGTTSPSEKLQVNNGKLYITESANASTANLIYLENSGSGGNEGVSIKFNPMFGAESMIASNREGAASDDANLTFHTALADVTTERMRIDSSGNVGIGTTLPLAKLDVDGVARARGGTYVADIDTKTDVAIVIAENDYIYTADGSSYLRKLIGKSNDIIKIGETGTSLIDGIDLMPGTTGGYVQVFNNSSVVAKFVDGKLGIGTTGPTSKLDIRQSTSGGSDVLGTGAITIGSDNPYWTLRGTATSLQDLAFDRNYSGTWYESMRIQRSTGNVGIGTDSPSEKLEVSGSNTLSIKLSRNNTDAVYVTTLTNNYSASLGTELKSGIYNILTHGNSTGTALNFTNGAMTFDYRNSEYMRITSTGNVGIGTTSPNEKLEVAGNIKIQSAVLSNQENTDVDTGTETVAEFSAAAFTAGFFDFVIKKTTNVRSGTVYACHDGTNVEFTETSTQDLGDTSDVTLSVDISGGNMRLRATTTSDDWSIKSLIRAI